MVVQFPAVTDLQLSTSHEEDSDSTDLSTSPNNSANFTERESGVHNGQGDSGIHGEVNKSGEGAN